MYAVPRGAGRRMEEDLVRLEAIRFLISCMSFMSVDSDV